MKKFLALFLFAAAAWSQVYAVNVTSPGTGYSTAPTVTASGGSCTTEPTFQATVSGGAVTAIVPTYLGVGCTAAPSLAIGGPGTGAAATAQMLPVNMGIQQVVPSSSCNGIAPAPGGQCTGYRFECWLTVPQYRVPFYNAKDPYVYPGTAQLTTVVSGENGESLPAAMVTDLTNGTLTAYASFFIQPSSASLATAEANVLSACNSAQAAVNSWNPWASYGTYYANGAWTALGVQ
jgi:hypothetical protein